MVRFRKIRIYWLKTKWNIVYKYLKTKIFSRNANILPQMHWTWNIFRPSAITIVVLGITKLSLTLGKQYAQKISGWGTAAHQDCNLNLSLSKKIPVVFHNLQNYNSHLIFQEPGKYDFKINVITRTIEKYMSFSIE